MKLKQHQTDTLSVLRRFFEETRVAGPKGAYEAITKEPDQAKRLGRYGGTYTPLAELPTVPYVCLRLPTGGGKTILGAHSIGIARDAWVEKDYPMVLWLVPTNTIRLQTAEALKNARHPYRQALDEAFDGRVRVFDIADFTHIRPHDIRDHCCIVVGTIQTLRVSNTEGRKVYSHNENMESPTDVIVIGRVRDLQHHQGQHCSGIVLLLAIGLPGGGYLLQLVGAAAHQHGIELPRLLRHKMIVSFSRPDACPTIWSPAMSGRPTTRARGPRLSSSAAASASSSTG
jgi:Type III restriction enzyme, res subunit